MKRLTKKTMFFLAMMSLIFNGCVKYKIVDDNKSSAKATNIEVDNVQENKILDDTILTYGDHTEDIEKLLTAIPVGSEVFLEDRGDGEWYIRIEKVFVKGKEYLGQSTMADDPIVEPYIEEVDSTLYGDTITI